MKPEAILEAYKRAITFKEKTDFAHQFISIIVDTPICERWNFSPHNLDDEMWKDIPGFYGYQASNKGRIQSSRQNNSGIWKVLRLQKRNKAYCVCLATEQGEKFVDVHRQIRV